MKIDNKPQKYTAKLIEKAYLDEGERFLSLKFELIKPNEVKFLAGQYISMKVSEVGERRSYSIVSTPDVDHAVTMVAEIIPEGLGSNYLCGLDYGAEVELLMPMGKFVVESDANKLLFVATGVGIAPIFAMINDLLINEGERRPMRLHWGMRYEKDIFWMDELEMLAEQHENFVYDLVLSKPGDSWKLCWGHVQDCINRDLDNMGEWEAYVCGNQKMIKNVKELLVEKGMNEDVINYEKFY